MRLSLLVTHDRNPHSLSFATPLQQVGQRKVEAAMASLDRGHNLRTVIQAHFLDVVREWDRIVSLARSCTAIFNAIDYGGFADEAIASLAYSLGVPYLTSSTYGNNFQNEFFTSTRHEVCWREVNDGAIRREEDAVTAWVSARGLLDKGLGPGDLAALLAEVHRMTSPFVLELVVEAMRGQPIVTLPHYFKEVLPRLNAAIDHALHPARIQTYARLDFIPKVRADLRPQCWREP